MPKLIDCEQRSSEWFRVRAGRLTASHMAELFSYSKQKGKEGIELKARSDYRMALLSERLTGQVARHFVTEEMKWGQEQEEYARTIYELKNSVFVEQIGFAIHPTMDFAGASPDGLVGEDGGIEIKCLTTANHLSILKSKQVPQEYYDQIQWNMVCCERFKWDFVCFDPRLPERLQMVIIPVMYDENRVAELESEVRKMNAEVEQAMKELAVNA
jgi:putative phage-type endonuclease